MDEDIKEDIEALETVFGNDWENFAEGKEVDSKLIKRFCIYQDQDIQDRSNLVYSILNR